MGGQVLVQVWRLWGHDYGIFFIGIEGLEVEFRACGAIDGGQTAPLLLKLGVRYCLALEIKFFE